MAHRKHPVKMMLIKNSFIEDGIVSSKSLGVQLVRPLSFAYIMFVKRQEKKIKDKVKTNGQCQEHKARS